MGVVKRTVFEMVIIGGLSVGIAIAANAIRVSGSIKVGKVYFPPRTSTTTQAQSGHDSSPLNQGAPGSVQQPDEEAHIEHEFQEITTSEVAQLLEDPNTALGLNLLFDARNDEAFNVGHIPGAIQVFPYEMERFIDEVLLEQIAVADKVVVYCNGGACEDSIYLCRHLVAEFGVIPEQLYLYAAGWEDWTKQGHPAEAGQP